MSDNLQRLREMWTTEDSIGLSVLHYVKEDKDAFFELNFADGKEVFHFFNKGPAWTIDPGPWPDGAPDCIIHYADYEILDELAKAQSHEQFLEIYAELVKQRRIKIEITSSLINMAGKGYVVFGKKVGAL